MFEKEKIYKLCFPIIYLILIFLQVIIKQEDLFYNQQLWQVPLAFLLIGCYVITPRSKKWIYLQTGILIGLDLWLAFYFDNGYSLMLPILFLKLGEHMKLRGLGVFWLIGINFCDQVIMYGVSVLVSWALYYYGDQLENHYLKMTKQFLKNEEQLQNTLVSKENLHRGEMESLALSATNERLEEKSRLAQALHDRLGHSINGSLFQLEACKLMLETRPEETKEKLQVIIDHLRGSMDEIRQILREEKPNSSEINETKLKRFCKDFEMQYGIGVELIMEGEMQKISPLIWKELFACIYEAFSNALKYANCDQIEVKLFVFNQVLRLEINDNGKGCEVITEGMGISGIKERIWKVNGSVSVNGQNGFAMRILVPNVEG